MRSIHKIVLCFAVSAFLFSSAAAPQTGGEWPAFHGSDRSNKSQEAGLLKSWPDGGPNMLFEIEGLGDSMEPTFKTGDTVLVDSSRVHMKSNGFYVFKLEENLYVKRVERLIDGRIKIQSDNSKYETIILEPEKVMDLEVFGRVVWRAETMI